MTPSQWTLAVCLSLAPVFGTAGSMTTMETQKYTCKTFGSGVVKPFNGSYFYVSSNCPFTFTRFTHNRVDCDITIRRGASGLLVNVEIIINKIKTVLHNGDVFVESNSVSLPFDHTYQHIFPYGIYTRLRSSLLPLAVTWHTVPGGIDALWVELEHELSTDIAGLCGKGVAAENNQQLIAESALLEDTCQIRDPTQTLNQVCRHFFSFTLDCLQAKIPHYIKICEWNIHSFEERKHIGCALYKEVADHCGNTSYIWGTWRFVTECAEPTCPGDLVYKEQGAAFVPTCSNPNHRVSIQEVTSTCVCPDGKVHNDHTDTYQCVKVSSCPCEFAGRTYLAGEIRQTKCQSCVCDGGKWICSENFCPPRCSIEGQYVTTFDGKQFVVPGKCTYMALKGPDWTVKIAYSKKGASLNMVTLQLHQETFTFAHNMVRVRDQDITDIYQSDHALVFWQSSIYIQVQTSFGMKLQVRVFPEVQIDITPPANHLAMISGLCGNSNSDTTDDFTTSSGIIENSAQAFALSWSVGTCGVNIPPSCINTDNEIYANEKCSVLNDPTGIFTECHGYIPTDQYLSACIQRTCNCGSNLLQCMCVALSSYANACSRLGVHVGDWRKVTNCTLPCPNNMEFSYHTATCNRTCLSLSGSDPTCGLEHEPVEGCGCPEGTRLNQGYTCTPRAECVCYHHGGITPPGPVVIDGRQCICENGELRCSKDCGCSDGKVCFHCSEYPVNTALKTCDSISKPLHANMTCESGCYCPHSQFEDHHGNCVPRQSCTCVFSGKIFGPGQEVRTNCKTCVCGEGQWHCQDEPCAGTCQVYGNGHYQTFDSKWYRFNGHCQYTLVEDYCGKTNGTFSISVESVPCCDEALTCSRSVTLHLKDEVSLILTDMRVTKKANNGWALSADPLYTIHTVGLYIVISVPSRGLTLIWDKHTRITIELHSFWRNRVCGLCGNFDSNEMNDLHMSGSAVVSSPLAFGNSWKADAPPCSDVTTEIFPCDRNSYCSAWAQRRCLILTGDIFKDCHLKVDPSPYYHACVQESCSCEFEGKFLGFCTSVAAYAEACSDQDICIDWRTPDLCPVYCDYYNQKDQCSWHYEACGKIMTCSKGNYLTHRLEGCYPRCPEEAPYYDENTDKCTPLRNCTCLFNDTVVQADETVKIDSVGCTCENGTIKCPSLPTTTPSTTATTETTMLSTTITPTTTTIRTSTTPPPTTTSTTTETTMLSTVTTPTTMIGTSTTNATWPTSTTPPPTTTTSTTTETTMLSTTITPTTTTFGTSTTPPPTTTTSTTGETTVLSTVTTPTTMIGTSTTNATWPTSTTPPPSTMTSTTGETTVLSTVTTPTTMIGTSTTNATWPTSTTPPPSTMTSTTGETTVLSTVTTPTTMIGTSTTNATWPTSTTPPPTTTTSTTTETTMLSTTITPTTTTFGTSTTPPPTTTTSTTRETTVLSTVTTPTTMIGTSTTNATWSTSTTPPPSTMTSTTGETTVLSTVTTPTTMIGTSTTNATWPTSTTPPPTTTTSITTETTMLSTTITPTTTTIGTSTTPPPTTTTSTTGETTMLSTVTTPTTMIGISTTNATWPTSTTPPTTTTIATSTTTDNWSTPVINSTTSRATSTTPTLTTEMPSSDTPTTYVTAETLWTSPNATSTSIIPITNASSTTTSTSVAPTVVDTTGTSTTSSTYSTATQVTSITDTTDYSTVLPTSVAPPTSFTGSSTFFTDSTTMSTTEVESTATSASTVTSTTQTTEPSTELSVVTDSKRTTGIATSPSTSSQIVHTSTETATSVSTIPSFTTTGQRPSTVNTFTTETTEPSTTLVSSTPKECVCKDLKRKKSWDCGETWTEDCFIKTCVNMKIELTPVDCPEKTIPTCPRDQATRVFDGCCETWKCDCQCDVYGDPHYISFQGVAFDFFDDCTYTLVEERVLRHNLTIVVDNFYCVPGLDGSCVKGIILRYQNSVASLTVIPNEFVVQATLNNVIIEPPYEEQGFRFETTGYMVSLDLPEIRSHVSLTPSSTMVIKLAMEHFVNNTQGQCGMCGGPSCIRRGGQIEADDCCDKTSYDWVYPDHSKPMCNSAPRDLPCDSGTTSTPPSTIIPTTTCASNPLCDLLLHPVFENCSTFVNLHLKKANCEFDSCRNPNGSCSSLEQAADECKKYGFCIDWRKLTNGSCDLPCPVGLVYRECADKMDDFCYGGVPYTGAHLEKPEGCFCPSGLRRAANHSQMCVNDCPYCKGPYGEPKLPGEVWKSNCKLCTCNNRTRKEECVVQTNKSTIDCGPGAVLVHSPCCDHFCVEKNCTYNGKTYKVGDEWRDSARPCKSFSCSTDGIQTETKVCPGESCPQEKRVWDDEHCCFTCDNTCAPQMSNISVTVENCTTVVEMPVCRGQCESEPRLVLHGDLQVEQESNCCRMMTSESRSVTLHCLDLSTRQYTYKHLTSCECRACMMWR